MSPKVQAWTGAVLVVVCTIIAPLSTPNLRLGTRFLPTAIALPIGLLCLITLLRRPGADRYAKWAPRLAAALIGWFLLSALLSDKPSISLVGQYVDGGGALFSCALIAAWAIGRTSFSNSRIIVNALLAALIANAVLATFQSFGMLPFGIQLFEGRAPGFMDNPIYLSQVLVGGWWLVADRYATTREWWWLGALAVIAVSIQAAGSRSILVILGAAAVLAFVIYKPRVGVVLAGVTVAGIVLVTFASPNSNVSGSSRIQNNGDFGSRVDTWKGGLHAVESRPIIGWGPARFREATSKYKTLRGARIDAPEALYTDAHDIAVNYLVDTGAVGLLLLAAFLLVTFLLAGWRNPLAIFGVLVLAGHLLEPSTPYTTPLAFLALGAGAASSVAVPVAGYLSTALVGASAWTVLAVGTWNLSAPGSTPASTMSRLRTARTLLHPWRQPYALSGQVSLRLTQLGVGDYSEQALSFFRAAANREPDDPSPWYDLGAQLQTMGFTAAARSAFMRGLAINPQSVVFRVALGNLDASTGDPADARTLFNQALVIQPGTPGAITGLASLNTVGPPG